nr:hypothetical protein [Tanacetum cinerariifolium]
TITLFDHHWIGEPVMVIDLSHDTYIHELVHFLQNGFSALWSLPALFLPYWGVSLSDFQLVLCDRAWHTSHVLRRYGGVVDGDNAAVYREFKHPVSRGWYHAYCWYSWSFNNAIVWRSGSTTVLSAVKYPFPTHRSFGVCIGGGFGKFAPSVASISFGVFVSEVYLSFPRLPL